MEQTSRPWWHARPFRRVLTKPLWWWHRRRPWPVREKVFGLPAHPVAEQARTRLVVLTTPAGLADAAWTAYSFLARLDRPPDRPLAMDLYVDTPEPGVLQAAAARWIGLFPGSGVRATWEAVRELSAQAPAMAALAEVHPMGRKLMVVLHAQDRDNVIFSDSDVLLLGDSPELAEAMAGGTRPLFNQEPGEISADPRLLDHARRAGWPPHAERFNCGLLYLPRQCLAIAEAERIVALGAHDPTTYFIDQTVLALMLGALGAQPLPPDRYLVSADGQFYGEQDADYARLSARHFTTPVRHRMYARGMPLLWKQWREKSP